MTGRLEFQERNIDPEVTTARHLRMGCTSLWHGKTLDEGKIAINLQALRQRWTCSGKILSLTVEWQL